MSQKLLKDSGQFLARRSAFGLQLFMLLPTPITMALRSGTRCFGQMDFTPACSWSLTCAFNHRGITTPLSPCHRMQHLSLVACPILPKGYSSLDHMLMQMNQRMFCAEAKSGEKLRGCRRANTREQVLRIRAWCCATGEIRERRRATIGRRIGHELVWAYKGKRPITGHIGTCWHG